MNTRKKKTTRRLSRQLVDAALLSRTRELESANEALADDNAAAREGWQTVYRALYPQAIDGPHLGMHINGSIDTIMRAITALRAKAGIPEGKNAD